MIVKTAASLCRSTLAALVGAAMVQPSPAAPAARFPADHGFLDVRAGFEWEGRELRAAGDGAADDTAALQAALRLAMKGPRRVVYLPAGTYRVTGPLTLGDDRGPTRRVILQEYSNAGSVAAFPDSIPAGLDLPIEDPPPPPDDPPENWVRVDPAGTDHTAAVQAAIDAAGQPGKGTVYFPSGRTYTLTDTIHVRGGVRRILGLDARIQPGGKLVSKQGTLFRFAALTSESVSLERFPAHRSRARDPRGRDARVA